MLLQGAFVLGLAWSPEPRSVLFGQYTMSSTLVAATGVGILILGLLARRAPATVAALLLAVTTTLLLSLAATAERAAIVTTRTVLPSDERVLVEAKIYHNHWLKIALGEHARYGPVAVPNTTGSERVDPDFNVTYAIDADGWRVIPDERPEVTVLGCSCAFGVGVEEAESFPALLNNRHWPGHKVRNYSLMGYGTRQAYLILEDRLKLDPPPVAVLYAWLYDHIRRNYLGLSFHGSLFPTGKFPFFELVGDRAVFQGLRENREATMPSDAPATFEKEVAVTIAMIRQMDEMCRARSIPFFLVALGQKYPLAKDPVLEFAQSSGIGLIDLRWMKEGFFENDPHPNREGHRMTAEAIARDERLAFLLPASAPPSPQPPKGSAASTER